MSRRTNIRFRSTGVAAIIALFLAVVSGAVAQSSLSIVDQLPPYDLTATVLANGHFSITTKYTGEDKTLIYQEDGSGGRPVNYTSHVHFKVDDIIFQLPYELNPVTRETPPEHPLEITTIYRDTAAGTPRINASMFGLMPDGDTMRFRLQMEPVKRPSGGFIRISAEVHNTTGIDRQVGVLLLIDTKIGDNDRAPIISAFGYETTETEFEWSVPPGMPPFWLALEGTPVQPGLTARGNLSADGLITPDYFLFGNWKDNTAINTPGLALAQWDERRAVNSGYTDSSILLLWEEELMRRGEKRMRASTEIGLVDSLHVGFGSGGWGGVALAGGGLGGGFGGGGGCLAFDTVAQLDCADPTSHPYTPDSLQALFLVTNDTAPRLDGAEVLIEQLPAGLRAGSMIGSVNPGTLTAGITGVSTLNFYALPRLFDTIYRVPVLVRANGGEDILRDTLCIRVPGLPSALELSKDDFLPLCPGLSDTIIIPARLKGAQCLDLLPAPQIVGTPPNVAQFAIVSPSPTQLPANGSAGIGVSYTATADGISHNVRLVVSLTQRGLNRFDRDTAIVIADTIDLVGEGRDAEFFMADADDTLDFGPVCLGDTALREWTITNVGGCDLIIDPSYTFENDPAGQYSLANDRDFPLTIERKLDGTALIRFVPTLPGQTEARFIIRSAARPFADTLIVTGIGDAPRYHAEYLPSDDTLCPDARFRIPISIENPTACPVPIDTIYADDAAFVPDAPGGFIIPPQSSRTAFFTGSFAAAGSYSTPIHIGSSVAGDTAITVVVTVASRDLDYQVTVDMGDVRVRSVGAPARVTVTATGTAGVEISRIRLTGTEAAEYAVATPSVPALPHRLEPGESFDIEITLTPADIGLRRGTLILETSKETTCEPREPIALTGRGVLPILDAPIRRYATGRVCIGNGIDTTIVLRNMGNAPLTILSADIRTVEGNGTIAVEGLPLTLGPDSSGVIAAAVSPESLGPFRFDIAFQSDGEFFTPGDTLVRLEGDGVICGRIQVDTVYALIGDVAEIPIRIDAAPLTGADVAALMNDAGLRGIDLLVEHDPTILRFRSEAPVAGMLSNLTAPAAANAAGSAVELITTNTNGDIGSGGPLAVLRADVLLGGTDRTPLQLTVREFAGGWADLTVHDGLLHAEYCALDQRYIRLSKPFIRAAQTPVPLEGALQFWLPESAHVTVELYDLSGRMLARLFEGTAPDGVTQLPLGPISPGSGLYIARMQTGGEVMSARVLIAE